MVTLGLCGIWYSQILATQPVIKVQSVRLGAHVYRISYVS